MGKGNVLFLEGHESRQVIKRTIQDLGFKCYMADSIDDLVCRLEYERIPFVKIIIGDEIRGEKREMEKCPEEWYFPMLIIKRVKQLAPKTPICFYSSFSHYAVRGTPTVNDNYEIRNYFKESHITVVDKIIRKPTPLESLINFLKSD